MTKKELRDSLRKDGYKYAFMLASNKKEYFATKEEMINGDFDDNSDWDCFELLKGEKWFKKDCKKPYNVVYKI